MIVKPRKKRKALREDELRVIHVGKDAVGELLWENLMEHQEVYFDVDAVNDNEICQMGWSQEGLTYAVMPIRYVMEGKQLDLKALAEKTGETTDSLFHPLRYRTMRITPDLFLK